MKLKRYRTIEKYIAENHLSDDEINKIKIERPTEIAVFYSNDGEMAGKLNFWHNRPDYEGKKTSYIGNIEIFEKYRKSGTEIFNNIFEHLKEEGIEVIIGPLNGTTWNTYRYVTDFGNHPPFLMEPWNDEYYVSLFEQSGFCPLAHYISTIMENMNPMKKGNLAKKIEKLKKLGYYENIKVKSAENENFLKVLNDVYDLTVASFKNNFLYSELEREIFLKMYTAYGDKIVKNLFKMAYLNDELIGYVFGIPDYLELGYKGKIETMILKTIAVTPKYNGKGIGYILIDELVKEAENIGYKNIIYALMHESNVSKNTGLLLGDILRKYTLFIKKL